jgi:two-component system, OmpR family, phosphate regulon sensor histidine kinase PhoR
LQHILWNAFWYISSLTVLSGFIAMVSPIRYGLMCLSMGLIGYLIYHLYWLNKLHLWLLKPSLTQIPSGYGTWENIFSLLYHDLRKNSRNQSQLSSALERFSYAASALPDAVVVLNNENEIDWFNDVAVKLLGLSKNHDENSPINYLIRQNEFVHYLNSEDYSEPLKLKSWRNPDITFEVVLIPFGAKQKLLLFRDISAFEKTETMRKDFIANVSHELRTPLTVIGGFLETISDMPGEVSPVAKPYFDLMQEQTSRMRGIIEDLLTLSKIENSLSDAENTTINMENLLQSVYRGALGLSKGKHKIELSLDNTLNIVGAQNELLSAFSNLVSNAIRYTPDGGHIHIKWGLMQNSPTFTVSDSGIGIDPSHIDRLTERFYRVDDGRSRDTGGTGLGLSIVKHILIRHQAKLNIESEPGMGSAFSIIFPASRIAVNNPAAN